ncbi:hypothetical protein GCM10017673_23850 [Streptosporangium violaceochromogenes]|nr:hypothetical protein GCM10017673_23850 [Streptosporangium violaceochromogenes]
MSWIIAAVVPAFAGLALLGFLAFRVFLATRRLGREVERARLRLARARGTLAAPPPGRRARSGPGRG